MDVVYFITILFLSTSLFWTHIIVIPNMWKRSTLEKAEIKIQERHDAFLYYNEQHKKIYYNSFLEVINHILDMEINEIEDYEKVLELMREDCLKNLKQMDIDRGDDILKQISFDNLNEEETT